jgi:hypothetical protein
MIGQSAAVTPSTGSNSVFNTAAFNALSEDISGIPIPASLTDSAWLPYAVGAGIWWVSSSKLLGILAIAGTYYLQGSKTS